MTTKPAWRASPMPTMRTDLGQLRMLAPTSRPRYTRGTHGEMWQWLGDGESLISLILAGRSGGEDSAEGTRHRLLAEVDRISQPLVRSPGSDLVLAEGAHVPGASAAYLARVDGLREGVAVHNAVLMAAIQGTSYLLHVVATDTTAGRELASTLSSGLQITE